MDGVGGKYSLDLITYLSSIIITASLLMGCCASRQRTTTFCMAHTSAIVTNMFCSSFHGFLVLNTFLRHVFVFSLVFFVSFLTTLTSRTYLCKTVNRQTRQTLRIKHSQATSFIFKLSVCGATCCQMASCVNLLCNSNASHNRFHTNKTFTKQMKQTNVHYKSTTTNVQFILRIVFR